RCRQQRRHCSNGRGPEGVGGTSRDHRQENPKIQRQPTRQYPHRRQHHRSPEDDGRPDERPRQKLTQNKGLQSAKVAYQGLIQNLREMAARNKDNSKMVAGFNRQIVNLTAAEERLNKVTEEQFSQAEGWVVVTKNIGLAAKEVTRL